jgi:Ca2+-binding EF-hand superfamily protein
MESKSIFIAIADHELGIEKQRQYLARLEEFEPYATFIRLDRSNNGYLTATEIFKFLKDNGLEASIEDCDYLISFFDSDEDGALNYTDYMQMVITCDDSDLRATVTQRDPYGVNNDEYLSPVLERELAILIQKELAYHNEVEYLKNSPDFDMERAFDELDDEGLGYIDHVSIDAYLGRNGFKATDEELTAIIRRMDVSADAKVSFAEFEEAMRPAHSVKPKKGDYKLSNPSLVKLENLKSGYYADEAPQKQKEVHFGDKLGSPSTYKSPVKKSTREEYAHSRTSYGTRR